MKKNSHLLFLFLLVLLNTYVFAQKDKSTNNTNRSVLIDFDPSMVNMLKVPAGWQVSIAASGLGKPRMLYNGPKGELYVTRRDAGDVLMLKDKDGDRKFEELVSVASDFKGVHGITMKDGWMFLCNNNEVRRYPMKEDGTLGMPETLIKDLPDGGQHSNRTMDFGPDGMLYISVGSMCNDCKETDKEAATMLQVDPKTWQRKLYASGLRNTIGFDWHPQTGELWGVDNGGDTKGDNWPPEELNHLVKDGIYGFPYAYGKREIDKSRENPPGDTKENWVKLTQPSSFEFQAHMAPIAFQFFGNAANIPAEYAGDGLVCWHGSWNREKSVGYKVQRIRFQNGQPVAAEDFLSGFLKSDKESMHIGRPAGVTITPAGVVYVSDDANGIIYAIKRTN